jgi:hypothetical protein
MKKEDRLVKKVKHLLKKAGMPRYLHRYGPKKYFLWNHAFALLVKSMCRLSYRRTTNFLRLLGFKIGSKSTLHNHARTIPLRVWQELLKATQSQHLNIAAIDGTGLSRSTRSWHYIKRIDGDFVNSFYKLSVCIDVNNRKFASIRLRAKRASDIKDVKYLIKNLTTTPIICLMDKGYDAEWLHQFLHSKNIKSIIPARNKAIAKSSTKGKFRKDMKFNFSKYQSTYNQRNIVESLIFAFKKNFGDSVNSKLISSANAEVYCRAIAYNLFLFFIRLSGQRLSQPRVLP